tara:strand:+ start:8723 stop:9892 length:1170 start_codon:yes stop_codon:yes gene_type:complete
MAEGDDSNGVPPGYFDVFKYGESNGAGGTYIDGPDSLANDSQMVVSFRHEPSGTDVFFKAFIMAFNETYSSDWVSEVVFGRTDPIHLFKQTSRRIALGIKVPAATQGEAFDNLARVQQLVQFLYPNYEKAGGAQLLAQNPFVRLKVMNLARSTVDLAGAGTPEDADKTANEAYQTLYREYKSTADPGKGLLGVITNLTVAHNIDNPGIGVLAKDGPSSNTILPKMIELSLDFAVIHEKTLGWMNDQGPEGPFNKDDPYFPYGVKTTGAAMKKLAEKRFSETTDKLPKGVTQQQIDDAKARFSGWWPKSRWKDEDDIKALKKIIDSGSIGPGRKEALRADLAYFESAQRGAIYLSARAGGQTPKVAGAGGPVDWTSDVNSPLGNVSEWIQ